jgi:hypothetical protein
MALCAGSDGRVGLFRASARPAHYTAPQRALVIFDLRNPGLAGKDRPRMNTDARGFLPDRCASASIRGSAADVLTLLAPACYHDPAYRTGDNREVNASIHDKRLA